MTPLAQPLPLTAHVAAGKPNFFSRHENEFIILLTSVTGLLSSMSSTIYLPALDLIGKSLHVEDSVVNLTITGYMVG